MDLEVELGYLDLADFSLGDMNLEEKLVFGLAAWINLLRFIYSKCCM